ncbi:MAG: TonB-dependent receptor, partial [Acidobacteriaceae bacterium]|nr:TonB-dependent receptor [Acidobacteriaceae bacterium]
MSRILSCSAASALLFFRIAVAAPPPAAISGSVMDTSGSVVSGALISLQQVAGSANLTATTDASGKFRFTDVAAGRYLLDASAPGLALAQPQSMTIARGEPQELNLRLDIAAVRTEVSVTAANEPQSPDQVTKALDIVNVDDAERRGLFSVSDAVRSVPGLRVSARGSPGSFTTIQTRGLRVTDTAILIDGYPFRDPTSIQDEASAYLGDMLLTDATRIEVLRGSGSSLYGSNAMSGTINLITDSGGGPVHGDLDLQGGGLGLFHGVARVSGGALDNRLTYSAALGYLNVTQGVNDAGAVRDWNGQGYVGYALTSNIRISADTFANTGYLQENVSPLTSPNAPTTGIIPAIPSVTFIPSPADPDAGRYSHFTNSLFRFEDEVNSRLSIRAGYSIFDAVRNNTNGPAGPYYQPVYNTSDQYSGRIDTARGQLNYLAGQHQLLTAGYEFQRENYLDVTTDTNPDPTQHINNRTKARQQTNAAFAQDELKFAGDRLIVLLSGRFTRATLYQPSFSGALSPYVQLPSPPDAYTGDASIAYFFRSTNTKARAHVGNSYRMPSLYERFGGYFYAGFYIPSGDPRLAPERAVSGDFGFDQYLAHERVKISGTYFYSRLQSIIGFLDFPPGYVDPYGRTGGYYNTAGGISRGVELSGEVHPARSTSVFASYTYTNAKDEVSQYYTGTAVSPLQTPRILPQTVTIV